ncbi:hypothetical protein ACWGDE_07630 [Streptomyces sp. NPDC054956]
MTQPLPRRSPARQIEGHPECAPRGGAFELELEASPDPSPALRERAESGLEKFFDSLAGEQDGTPG